MSRRIKAFATFEKASVYACNDKGKLLEPQRSVVKSGRLRIDLKFLTRIGGFTGLTRAFIDTGATISLLPRKLVNGLMIKLSSDEGPVYAEQNSLLFREFVAREQAQGTLESEKVLGNILEVKEVTFRVDGYPHREFKMTCAITEYGDYPLLGMPDLHANFRLKEGTIFGCPGLYLNLIEDHPYRYFVGYHPDIAGLLQKLRTQVFQTGRYNPVQPFPDNPYALKFETPEPILPPKSMTEAIALAGPVGTRSILDLERLSETPEYRAICPLDDADLERFFGTTQPTLAMVEQNAAYLSHLDRGQGAYVVFYRNGEPHGICFAGFPF